MLEEGGEARAVGGEPDELVIREIKRSPGAVAPDTTMCSLFSPESEFNFFSNNPRASIMAG